MADELEGARELARETACRAENAAEEAIRASGGAESPEGRAAIRTLERLRDGLTTDDANGRGDVVGANIHGQHGTRWRIEVSPGPFGCTVNALRQARRRW